MGKDRERINWVLREKDTERGRERGGRKWKVGEEKVWINSAQENEKKKVGVASLELVEVEEEGVIKTFHRETTLAEAGGEAVIAAAAVVVDILYYLQNVQINVCYSRSRISSWCGSENVLAAAKVGPLIVVVIVIEICVVHTYTHVGSLRC